MKPVESLHGYAPWRSTAAWAAVLFLVAFGASGMVSTSPQGKWPSDWPKELEPLRSCSKTVTIATGIQQDIYEIPFTNRSEFQKIWPTILNLKSPGAPLRLFRVGSSPPRQWGSLLSNRSPCVRIYAPTGGYTGGPSGGATPNLQAVQRLVETGEMLHAGPPWPPSVLTSTGHLPEFVVADRRAGRLEWVSAVGNAKGQNPEKPAGFLFRARVDLDLVVDGTVVDMNEVLIPADTPILDERFGTDAAR